MSVRTSGPDGGVTFRYCPRAGSLFRGVETMLMTMPKKLWLLAAIVAPGLALGDEPAPQAQALATAEAILEHCAALIPAEADRFRKQGTLLTQGASEETLVKVRKSDEYQQSRDLAL